MVYWFKCPWFWEVCCWVILTDFNFSSKPMTQWLYWFCSEQPDLEIWGWGYVRCYHLGFYYFISPPPPSPRGSWDSSDGGMSAHGAHLRPTPQALSLSHLFSWTCSWQWSLFCIWSWSRITACSYWCPFFWGGGVKQLRMLFWLLCD